MNKQTITTLTLLVLAGTWGALQPMIFSPESFGFTWLITAILGGAIIGWKIREITNFLWY